MAADEGGTAAVGEFDAEDGGRVSCYCGGMRGAVYWGTNRDHFGYFQSKLTNTIIVCNLSTELSK